MKTGMEFKDLIEVCEIIAKSDDLKEVGFVYLGNKNNAYAFMQKLQNVGLRDFFKDLSTYSPDDWRYDPDWTLSANCDEISGKMNGYGCDDDSDQVPEDFKTEEPPTEDQQVYCDKLKELFYKEFQYLARLVVNDKFDYSNEGHQSKLKNMAESLADHIVYKTPHAHYGFRPDAVLSLEEVDALLNAVSEGDAAQIEREEKAKKEREDNKKEVTQHECEDCCNCDCDEEDVEPIEPDKEWILIGDEVDSAIEGQLANDEKRALEQGIFTKKAIYDILESKTKIEAGQIYHEAMSRYHHDQLAGYLLDIIIAHHQEKVKNLNE